jgi:hypothetical protein
MRIFIACQRRRGDKHESGACWQIHARSRRSPVDPHSPTCALHLPRASGMSIGMAKAHDTWKVLPHDPIEEVAENLWRVEGSLARLPLRRVMTVVKRSDGGLVIHSPIALDDTSMAKLDGWGRVSFLIVPSAYHRLDAPAFKQRYPEAQVLCPRGVRAKVEKAVHVDGTYEDFPTDPAVEIANLDGMAEQEGVMTM